MAFHLNDMLSTFTPFFQNCARESLLRLNGSNNDYFEFFTPGRKAQYFKTDSCDSEKSVQYDVVFTLGRENLRQTCLSSFQLIRSQDRRV